MARVRTVSGVGLLGLVLFGPGLRAQPGAPPTIHSVTLRPDSGVLTVRGTGLGTSLHVTVDGQPATVLPGATDSELAVQAPVSLLTVAGTYRLTVADPLRRAWDGFIVASVPLAAGVSTDLAAATPGPGRSPFADAAPPRPPADAAARRPSGAAVPVPMTVIEDPGSPFRTALGFQALASNTTGLGNTAVGYRSLVANASGDWNTAIGREALSANSGGDANTAVGAYALGNSGSGQRNTALGANALQSNLASDNTAVGSLSLSSTITGTLNTAVGVSALRSNIGGAGSVAVGFEALESADAGGNTGVGYQALRAAAGVNNTALGSGAGRDALGTSNIFVGALVYGQAADSNTIRIGRALVSGQGQNRAFIAGIRGTTVAGGEGVYIDANGQLGSGPVVPAADTVGAAQVIADSLTGADLAAGSVGTSELVDNAVTAAKVGFNYAASTTEGGPATDVACVACVAATEVGFAFAGLGGNTFTGTQRIGNGNVELGPSTPATGNLLKSGAFFLHNPGFMNTFLGEAAGSATVTGGTNTAVGGDALRSVAGGDANLATGYGALYSNVSGTSNTASGMQALFSATGSYNTAVGMNAGASAATGSHNVYVGAGVGGTAADANTMRLGLPFNATTGAGQNKTFIAGIAGTVLTTPAVQVFVDANGQLGTLVPPPIVGTISGGVTAGAAPPADVAVYQLLAAQRAEIADLRARLAALEGRLAVVPRRR